MKFKKKVSPDLAGKKECELSQIIGRYCEVSYTGARLSGSLNSLDRAKRNLGHRAGL